MLGVSLQPRASLRPHRKAESTFPSSIVVRSSNRRRLWLAVLLTVLIGTMITGCGSSTTTSTSDPTSLGTPRIDVAYISQVKATVLVNGSGYALYMFVPDHQRSVTCDVTCAASWPLVTISPGAHPRIGAGVRKSLISTIAFTPGFRVVTYNRWPLYTYEDDVSPGMATGQGTDLNGGYWYLMSPDGNPLVPAGDPSP